MTIRVLVSNTGHPPLGRKLAVTTRDDGKPTVEAPTIIPPGETREFHVWDVRDLVVAEVPD